MRRASSDLFSPYRNLGIVCSEVIPSVRKTFVGKRSSTSLLCTSGNVVLNYNAEKLRFICSSEPLPLNISCLASSSSCVYAACGNKIAVLPFCRDVQRWFTCSDHPIRQMTLVGSQLVAYDENSGIVVIDTESGEKSLYMEGSDVFKITCILHPSTYLNKVILGSSCGRLKLINFRAGKVIYEFNKDWKASVNVLQQSTVVDIIAVGLSDGQVNIINIRENLIIYNFRHDSEVTAISFRDDGVPTMASADSNGTIAIWHLEKEELVGKIANVHTNAVHLLYFVPGEPIMISTSHDNSMRTWIFDSLDGMPRELAVAEGHSQPVNSLTFSDKSQILSSGFDGTVRKCDTNLLTMRHKLGTAAVMSKSDAKKKGFAFKDVRLEPVVEMAIGWAREAAWDNVLCRHKNSPLVTTWTTRKNCVGTHKLVHHRFTKSENLIGTVATAICLSPCGNFAFIGYSSGHVDKFNVQSGRHLHTYSEGVLKTKTHKGVKKNIITKVKAHNSSISGLTIDQRGTKLCSACSTGVVRFWDTKSGGCVARLKTPSLTIDKTIACAVNNLIAVSCQTSHGKPSVAIVDSICHRIVRFFKHIGNGTNAVTFSSDGKWLLVADRESYIRVFDLSTSDLIDVLLFDKPCIGMSFNSTGEYMATIHEEDKAIYVWANKMMFATVVCIRSLPVDYIPSWEDRTAAVVIDDDDDEMLDAEERFARDLQIDESLVTYSGWAPSRWANLPNLGMIKERNKPTEAPRKAKQVPFFLAAAPTLEGFEFEEKQGSEHFGDRKLLQAKRSFLDLESSFSVLLRKSNSREQLLASFEELKTMSVSAIDFQIRSLSSDVLPQFFQMLLEVLKTKRDFELVQSYMATAVKIHRRELWESDDSEMLTNVLADLNKEQKAIWNEYESLMLHDTAVVQWIKNALL